MSELPSGWVETKLAEICEFNPKHPADTDRSQEVSFVPMSSVSEILGTIQAHTARPLKEIWKGYTHFKDGDVIFAKITPCMENGKIAIASELHGGMACGSTEFFVLRPHEGVSPRLLWYFLRQPAFRGEAERHMTGAVGQQRVPLDYLKGRIFPVPPAGEQDRIVEQLDSLSARTRATREEIDRATILIEHYRQEVLTAAFRGDLTTEWRATHSAVEAAHDFLAARAAVQSARLQMPTLGRDERSAMLPRDGALKNAVSNRASEVALPEQWEWCGLGEVFGVYVGATPSRKEATFWGGDVPWVSSGEVAFCRISDTEEKITAVGLAQRLHSPASARHCASRYDWGGED